MDYPTLDPAVLVLPVVAPATAPPIGHVRPTDQWAKKMLDAGLAKSLTFRQLVDTLNRSTVFVMLSAGGGRRCADNRQSCLRWMGGKPEARFVLVTLVPPIGNAEAVGWLGHELRHAVEIAEAPDVTSGPALRALYLRIGAALYAQTGEDNMANGHFETVAAVNAGRQITREMQK